MNETKVIPKEASTIDAMLFGDEIGRVTIVATQINIYSLSKS